MKQFFLFVSFAALTIVAKAQTHQLVKKWESDSVFKVPESVRYDAANNVLYVANIDGTEPWGRDGKGSIGKIGADGKVIAAEWITGLNAPKGMGLYKGKLYVADLTELVTIDLATATIENKLTVPGADRLNDVCVDSKGVIYVSDSRGRKVYQVKKGVTELLLDSFKLKGPNGVLKHKKVLYVLDAGGMYKMNKDKSLTKITDGMEGGTDGIENIDGGDFIVSCWAGAIWYVNSSGTKELLLDTRAAKINSADIGMDAGARTIYVPTFWKNSVVAYEVK